MRAESAARAVCRRLIRGHDGRVGGRAHLPLYELTTIGSSGYLVGQLSLVALGCADRDVVESGHHHLVEVDVADGEVGFEVVDGRGAGDQECVR